MLAELTLFVTVPFTAAHSFTADIEGASCDAQGNVYAVSFSRQPTVGRVDPSGRGEVWIELAGGSLGGGTRFDRAGFLYIADYTKHNILRVNPKTKEISIFAHEPSMYQPNDLAIGPDGTLWASDPDWDSGKGQVWRIDRQGRISKAIDGMGTTNGIEVSPDGKTLYVNESIEHTLWAFTIKPDGRLVDKRLVIRFPDHGLDGMRSDVQGNLFITRPGKGTIAVLSPSGKLLREISALGKNPTNLCFGGADGKSVYVTEADEGRIVQFRVEHAGLEWQRWKGTGVRHVQRNK